jgi:hypothetical protein
MIFGPSTICSEETTPPFAIVSNSEKTKELIKYIANGKIIKMFSFILYDFKYFSETVTSKTVI